ncbi:gliding motility lipoprotein GldH [Flavobacteriaceae bacterium R38]|nr:gliding motility lipoprotein GldH [Flavobacteriaceae bacterium R38]
MFKKSFFLLSSIILFISCDSKGVFSEYKSVANDWKKNEKIEFSFPAPDTTKAYNMFINVRNDKTYEFSNLFLIVHMNFPDGKIISDTIEYEMAKPNGEWLGKGFTSLKESKLWYKENVTFPNSGTYNVQIEHAMRINGRVEGIESLKGIKDVGVKLENASIQ